MEKHHRNVTMPFEGVDPVCAMTVASEDAASTHTYEGETYYFCSHSCVQRFKENPQKFLHKPVAGEITAEDNETEYTCPMDPEIRQKGPGACPKCGMALEPAIIARRLNQ